VDNGIACERNAVMRDSRQVLDFIDWLIGNWLRAPEMYALDSSSLEGMFTLVEEMREFILDEREDRAPLDIGYIRFLETQGYGTATFTRRHPSPKNQERSRKAFEPLCDFLRAYLASEFRKQRTGEGDAWKRKQREEPRLFDDEGKEWRAQF